MDHLQYDPEAYYIFDRGYVDYTRLYKITMHSASFVVRAKKNLQFNRMYSREYDKSIGIKFDQIGKLSGCYVSKNILKNSAELSSMIRKLTELLFF